MGRRKAHPHLLRTEADPAALAPLVRAVESDPTPPNRVGWLVWTPEVPATTRSRPEDLAAAADAGLHGAVRVDATGSVSLRPRKGPPVLADVLRVQFPGCRLVLVRGDVDAPEILPAGNDRYEIRHDGDRHELDAEALADRLRRPRPFAS